MTEFTIRIADRTVRIQALFETTRDFCRDYLEEGQPEFTVSVGPEDLQFEREKSAREDALEGIPTRVFPDAYLETLAVYRKIADQLLAYDTLLFHGSAIAVDGVGYLFTAKSGTGKSTHTRLWRELLGSRAVMINDDKPLLRITDEGVLVYGTPWNGKHRLGTNLSVPLKAICILERGEENRIREITPKEALPMLLQQSYRPADPGKMLRLLELLDRLTGKLRFYRLSCNMDPEAAEIAYEALRTSGRN